MNEIQTFQPINELGSSRRGGKSGATDEQGGTKFGRFMDDVADVSLSAISTVAPVLPGGEIVKMAADGLKKLKAETPGALGQSGSSPNFDKMWEMQRRNQVYNMQYFQLQQAAQAQNRKFKTLSNLMKVRHDTAKSAINNMRA